MTTKQYRDNGLSRRLLNGSLKRKEPVPGWLCGRWERRVSRIKVTLRFLARTLKFHQRVCILTHYYLCICKFWASLLEVNPNFSLHLMLVVQLKTSYEMSSALSIYRKGRASGHCYVIINVKAGSFE